MAFTFNACEVFEMAEEIERNGVKFYRQGAENFKDSDTHNTLLQLADWEARHQEMFAAIKNEFSQEDCPPTVFDPDGEDAWYLQAMADNHVFDTKTHPLKQLTGKENLKDILKMAIRMAKDAVAFYLGLKALIPTDSGKDKVDIIIKEEMHHIGILNRELGALT